MNLNQLRYFVSVATYKSFTQAADCHYMTQTSITQQIKALEDNIGVQLINRQRRPIELTPAGKVFLHEAKLILATMDDAIVRTQEASIGAVGTIRIGYEKGYERSNLSDRLRAFHRQYPNILFTCIREDTDKLAEDLLSNKLDIIFSWDSANIKRDYEISSRLDMHSRLCVAMYTNHPLARKTSIKREALKDDTILYMSPSGQGNSFGDVHFMNLYEKAGYQPKILLNSSDIESLLIMVAAEEGITIVPSYSVEKLTNAENLVFVPLEGEDEYEDIYMLWRKEHGNSALSCFLEM